MIIAAGGNFSAKNEQGETPLDILPEIGDFASKCAPRSK
jgi:hypothetical protein